jgi:hypothetical protein
MANRNLPLHREQKREVAGSRSVGGSRRKARWFQSASYCLPRVRTKFDGNSINIVLGLFVETGVGLIIVSVTEKVTRGAQIFRWVM